MSPLASCGAGTFSTSATAMNAPGCQPVTRRATVPCRVLRRVSAWALPRPSATASARLANTTVSPQPAGDQPREPGRVGDREDGGEGGADLDDQHHGVAPHESAGRACPARRAGPATAVWGRAAAAPGGRAGAGGVSSRSVLPPAGPSASAGRNVSATAPRSRRSPCRRTGECGSAGARRGGCRACRARRPARPSTNTIGRNRPSSMHRPSARSTTGVHGEAGEGGAVVVVAEVKA